MKQLKKLGWVALLGVMSSAPVMAEDGGFQIAPPPIAHPIFVAGAKDQKFDFNYISMSSSETDIDLTGFGASYIVREAYSDSLALSAQAGLFLMTGTMPGVALPYFDYPSFFTPINVRNADVTMFSIPFSANIEMQLIKEDAASLIVFIGPNLGMSSMTMQTSYDLQRDDSAIFTGFTSTTQMTMVTAGLQFGMQAGLRVSDDVKISPFFMVSSSSGTSNMTYSSGISGDADTTATGDIPDITTSSIGMDIIIKELSIGTVLQDIQRSNDDGSDAGGMETVMLRFGYKF